MLLLLGSPLIMCLVTFFHQIVILISDNPCGALLDSNALPVDSTTISILLVYDELVITVVDKDGLSPFGLQNFRVTCGFITVRRRHHDQ